MTTDIRIAMIRTGAVPHPSRFTHTDVDGDRLLISTALFDDGTPGLYFRTDPNGSSLPLTALDTLIARLQVIAKASREEATAAAPTDCQCLPASPMAPRIYCDACRATGAGPASDEDPEAACMRAMADEDIASHPDRI